MARFDIRDMKEQASSYFREKVKSVRLALTDVSRIQLLAEEATNADPWGPETRTMAVLSEAAFELEEYERIVQVLHSRLDPYAKRPWKQVFKTLTVLEYLLTHGPGSLSNEFKADTVSIEELCQYKFIDQQGIDRGVSIRNKADRMLELLSKSDLWKEERTRAQKISDGIRGFGSSIERENVATEKEENHHIKSDVSKPKDAESESLLSDETSREAQPDVSPRVEWKPFEKCTSIPSYLRHDDENSPSSPSHFRSTSPSILQTFSSETHNESTFGSDTFKAETGDHVLLQASADANKEATPSSEVLQVKFRDAPQLDKVVPPPHLSMRRLFHFHKPVAQKNANHEEEKGAADAFQTPMHIVSISTIPGTSSDLPKLPPPPPSKFRRRIQHHLQPSNLIDL